MHALGLERLRAPDVAFWAAWDGEAVLGCAALKTLGPGHAELKSMRTASAHLRRGVGTALLAHVLDAARRRGDRRVSLETGTTPDFEAAHALYRRFGFVDCGPFAHYREDPCSRFMTRSLDP